MSTPADRGRRREGAGVFSTTIVRNDRITSSGGIDLIQPEPRVAGPAAGVRNEARTRSTSSRGRPTSFGRRFVDPAVIDPTQPVGKDTRDRRVRQQLTFGPGSPKP